MSREVFYGRSVRRSEGSRTAKGIVGRRMADGRKFLLLFRTTHFFKPQKIIIKAIFKSQNTYIRCLPKVKNIYIKALKMMLKSGLNRVFWQFWKSSPKISQIFRLPKQNIDSQMVLKVAEMATNCQIWQHC